MDLPGAPMKHLPVVQAVQGLPPSTCHRSHTTALSSGRAGGSGSGAQPVVESAATLVSSTAQPHLGLHLLHVAVAGHMQQRRFGGLGVALAGGQHTELNGDELHGGQASRAVAGLHPPAPAAVVTSQHHRLLLGSSSSMPYVTWEQRGTEGSSEGRCLPLWWPVSWQGRCRQMAGMCAGGHRRCGIGAEESWPHHLENWEELLK